MVTKAIEVDDIMTLEHYPVGCMYVERVRPQKDWSISWCDRQNI